MSGSLGRQVALGAAFMVAGRLAIRMISVVSTLILARLLLPEDFGIIALAAAIFTIADTITATGYAALLVRRERVDRDAYDTAWTMNIIRCALLGAIVAITAPLQAALFEEPRIVGVLLVVSATMVVDALSSIGLVRLQRELRFGPIFRLQVLQRLMSFGLTVAIAWIWASYWALVLGNLLTKLVTVPLSYRLAPHRPRFCLAHWREFMSFSKWMFGVNLCNGIEGQSANLSLGAATGAASVGRYNIAYQIGAAPVTELAVPMRQPLYAGLARALGDEAWLRRSFLDGLGVLVTVITPLSVGIALVADEIAAIALGPRWPAMGSLIALCALYSLFDCLSHQMQNVFLLRNRMRRLFLTYASIIGCRVPLVWAAALQGGEIGMLLASLAASSAAFLAWSASARTVIGVRLRDVARQCARPCLAAAAMALAVLLLRPALPPAEPGMLDDMLRLAACAALGAAFHVGTQAALWLAEGRPDGAERRLAAILVERFPWLRRGRLEQ